MSFLTDSSPSLNIRRAAGPSTATGFSMKTLIPLLDGISEMNPAEGRRRGEDDHVVLRSEQVHDLFERIKADELVVLGDLDFVAELLVFAETSVAIVQPILVHIGHGDEFDRSLLSRQSIGRRSGSASAATHERDINGIALTGVQAREAEADG